MWNKTELILERKRFFTALSHVHFRFLRSWASDRSISKRYLKSDIAPWVEKSLRAFHARDTGFYWSSKNTLHELFIASSGVRVWMKMPQLIAKRYKAVLEPRVSPAFAITYFCNHCNIRFENTSKYVDTLTFFPKTWTKGHWPLDDLWPHVSWGHMCDSTQGSLCPSPMTVHQCMWIQWSILQNTTYIHTHTYYVHTMYILHTTYRMSDHIVSYWTQFRRDNYWTQFRRDNYWTQFRRDNYWTQFRRDNYWTQFRRDNKNTSVRVWIHFNSPVSTNLSVPFHTHSNLSNMQSFS